MYNNHMDDKQSILNDLQMMNFFGDSNEETNTKTQNHFQIKLFKQLKYNFPNLTKHVSLEDMDYIITQFNLSKQNYINKENIKKLIQFLKIHDTLKQQEKTQFEQKIEHNIQQQQFNKTNSYEEISTAIDFFNQITDNDDNHNNQINNNNNRDIAKVTNISQSKKEAPYNT